MNNRILIPLLVLVSTTLNGKVAFAQQDLSFVDEFKGSSLSPAFRIVNPDKQRFALVNNDYLMVLTHERFKNVVTYTEKLPESFEVTLRVEEPMLHSNQIVLLRIGDTDNNVRIGAYLGFEEPRQSMPTLTLSPGSRRGGNGVTFYSNKTLNGENSEQLDFDFEGLKGKPFYLRIIKSGVEFEMLFSHNGNQWGSLGKQIMLDGPQTVSFEAYLANNAPETGVKFDYFEIIDLSVR